MLWKILKRVEKLERVERGSGSNETKESLVS